MFFVLLAPEAAALAGAGACYMGASNPEVLRDIAETGAEALGVASEYVTKAFFSVFSNFTARITSDVASGVTSAPTIASFATSAGTSKVAGATGAKLGEAAGKVAAENVAQNTTKSKLRQMLPYLAGGAGIMIAAGIGYYIWSGSTWATSGEKRNAVPNPPAHMQDDGDDEHNEDKDDDSPKKEPSANENTPQIDKEVLISKKMMKELMKEYGESIYNKLKTILTLDKQGKVWSDPKRRFRIDAGSVLDKHPRMKTWNLQVNRDPPGHEAKTLLQDLGKRSTHKKLLWGVWDFDDPPSYETWVQLVMSLFDD